MDELFLNCMLSMNTIVGGRGWLKKFIKTFLKIRFSTRNFLLGSRILESQDFVLLINEYGIFLSF